MSFGVTTRPRKASLPLPALLAALTLAMAADGCKAGEKLIDPACVAAKDGIAGAVANHEFSQARSLRTEAYRACEDPKALALFDQSIVDGESNAALEKAWNERTSQQKAAYVAFFLDFVKQHRDAPAGASNGARCAPVTPPATVAASLKAEDDEDDEDDTEAEEDDSPEVGRFCTARRQVGARHLIEIHYSEADPSLFRFTTTVLGTLDCSQLGGKEAETWTVDGPGGSHTKRARCELGGPLSGLDAVVGTGRIAGLNVFSATYLDHVPEARAMLDAPGN